jgi:hypothetical protein
MIIPVAFTPTNNYHMNLIMCVTFGTTCAKEKRTWSNGLAFTRTSFKEICYSNVQKCDHIHLDLVGLSLVLTCSSHVAFVL